MAGGGAGARCPSFSVRAARQPQACDGGMVALRLHAADLALMLPRLSQGNARDFSCTRPSSSIEPNSKVGYGLGDVRDGGAEPRDPTGDADERRSSLRVALRCAASRQSAAVGTCGACMTDQWTGGERAGRRFARRFGRVREAVPPPALCLASCPHRACSLWPVHRA